MRTRLVEPILWLIGVDEKAGTIPGVAPQEVSNWWAQVQRHFDELSPVVEMLTVPFEGITIMALLFPTDRAPFVIKNPSGPEKEVPWREGTAVRSASRSDLIRILVPRKFLPKLEVRSGRLILRRLQRSVVGSANLFFQSQFYVEPHDDRRLYFPFHRCSAVVKDEAGNSLIDLADIRLFPAGIDERVPHASAGNEEWVIEKTVHRGGKQVIVEGSGLLGAVSEMSWPDLDDVPLIPGLDLQVTVRFGIAGIDLPSTTSFKLRPHSNVRVNEPDYVGNWEFG